MTFLKNLNWRHATKAFVTNESIAKEKLDAVLEAARLAPTSFGLQPFRVHVIQNQDLKVQMAKAGWSQPQWTTAPVTLVWTSLANVSQRITDFLDLMSAGNAAAREGLRGYEGMMRGALETRTPDALHNWAAKQAYISLGFAMAACAELQLDSCPMEGFDPPSFDKILRLEGHEKSCVALCLGTRDPKANIRPKVRFPSHSLFKPHS